MKPNYVLEVWFTDGEYVHATFADKTPALEKAKHLLKLCSPKSDPDLYVGALSKMVTVPCCGSVAVDSGAIRELSLTWAV